MLLLFGTIANAALYAAARSLTIHRSIIACSNANPLSSYSCGSCHLHHMHMGATRLHHVTPDCMGLYAALCFLLAHPGLHRIYQLTCISSQPVYRWKEVCGSCAFLQGMHASATCGLVAVLFATCAARPQLFAPRLFTQVAPLAILLLLALALTAQPFAVGSFETTTLPAAASHLVVKYPSSCKAGRHLHSSQ